MKALLKILAVTVLLLTNNVMAQEDISGTWQGVLELGGDSKLTVQFILEKQADGSWSAVVNSPDMGGIKNGMEEPACDHFPSNAPSLRTPA